MFFLGDQWILPRELRVHAIVEWQRSGIGHYCSAMCFDPVPALEVSYSPYVEGFSLQCHKSQFALDFLPHLHRLLLVGSVFRAEFNRKFTVPQGRLNMNDFHIGSLCSSSYTRRKCPCCVSDFRWLFHVSHISDLMDFTRTRLTVGSLLDLLGLSFDWTVSRAFCEYVAVENFVFHLCLRCSLLSSASFTTWSALIREDTSAIAWHCRYIYLSDGMSVNRAVCMIFGDDDLERLSHVLGTGYT